MSLSPSEITEINDVVKFELFPNQEKLTGTSISSLESLNLDELSEKEWPYIGDNKLPLQLIPKENDRELFSRSMRTRPRKSLPQKTIVEGTSTISI